MSIGLRVLEKKVSDLEKDLDSFEKEYETRIKELEQETKNLKTYIFRITQILNLHNTSINLIAKCLSEYSADETYADIKKH